MVPNELLEYVKLSFARGTSTDSIYSTLMSQGGWTREDIDQAFLVAFPGVPEKTEVKQEVSKSASASAPALEPKPVSDVVQTPLQTNPTQIKPENPATNTQTQIPKSHTITSNSNPVITPYAQVQKQNDAFAQNMAQQKQDIRLSKSGGGMMRTILKTLLILVVVASLCVGGYFAYGYFTKDKINVMPDNSGIDVSAKDDTTTDLGLDVATTTDYTVENLEIDSSSDVKINMLKIYEESIIYYKENNESYLDLCKSSEVASVLGEVSVASDGYVPCVDADDFWVASSILSTNENQWWCVDYTGVSRAISTNITPQSTRCPDK